MIQSYRFIYTEERMRDMKMDYPLVNYEESTAYENGEMEQQFYEELIKVKDDFY